MRVEPLRLDGIFQNCQQHFKSLNLLSPSRNTVAKLILSIFHVKKCVVYKTGESYSAYEGLIQRTEPANKTKLIVPEHCLAKINNNNELEITCGREFIVDGEQATCSVTFRQQSTHVNVRGVVTQLNIQILPTQKSVDGLVFLLMNIPMCKGVPSGSANGELIREIWSEITNKSVFEERVRFNSCKNVLSFCSKIGYCEPCGNNMRKILNRKDAAESNMTKPDVTEPDITEVNDNELKQIEMTTNSCRQKAVMEAVDRLLIDGAPQHFKTLLLAQINNSKENMDSRQRRWDPEVISLCLSLYVRSPAALEDLRNANMLTLPSVRLLQLYKNCIEQKPGLTDDNLSWMSKEAERQEVSEFGKRGGMILDELTIQDDLQIQRKGNAWSLSGACDMGPLNNEITIITTGSVKTELASHCLQVMFHGFCGFRWPVAYYGSNPAKAHQLYLNIWDCVDALDEKGFVVDYIMFDGASTNRSLTNILTNDMSRERKFQTTSIYDCEHKVAIIQDPKHVIKKIRNNIEASNEENRTKAGRLLMLHDRTITWTHFKNAYLFNTQMGFRIHRKLTKEHIEISGASKMRNKLAEEILNADMLYLMKSYQATLSYPEMLGATVELLENTSVLVRFFSDTRPVTSVTDSRLDELRKVLMFFTHWEEEVKASKRLSEHKHLMTNETRDDIYSCISGFLGLCENVLGGGNSITPAHVNSDLVENHFCQQRGVCGGQNTNPTLKQYGYSNTSICLGQTTISKKRNSNTKAQHFRATTPGPLKKRKTSETN